MRYAFFSDIHSNMEAFSVVLEDINNSRVDTLLFLGDIVGYGPNPNECIDMLLQTPGVAIALGGNHDWAAVGMTDTSYFNPFAKEALDWTVENLKDEHKEFLKRTRPADNIDHFQVAHSSPMLPEEWRYILSYPEASANYPFLTTDLCFIGHSHMPLVIDYTSQTDFTTFRGDRLEMKPDRKYIVNIGSVGQPRDGIPKSCWVLYDSDDNSITYNRVEYDIKAVQSKMVIAGLPKYLVDRLASGK